jgi:hypothetical protein
MLGPELPLPQRLTEHPLFKQAVANLSAVYDWIDLDYNNSTGSSNYSYSIQIFSTLPAPSPVLWERFHTAPNLPTLNSKGVTKVDADTVYRIGSITKVFTILAFLAEAGDRYFNEPIGRFIPEIREIIERDKAREGDGVWKVDWEDITVGSLASQMSGIERDCK